MALAEVHIRPALAADGETLVAIEQEAFSDPRWNASDFAQYNCMVAEVSGRIAGFLVFREIFPGLADAPVEREILNLAVAAGFRRMGIARSLLNSQSQDQATLYLEVRKSNKAAIHLYTNVGFKEISERPHYYDNPSESAIVMRLKW